MLEWSAILKWAAITVLPFIGFVLLGAFTANKATLAEDMRAEPKVFSAAKDTAASDTTVPPAPETSSNATLARDSHAPDTLTRDTIAKGEADLPAEAAPQSPTSEPVLSDPTLAEPTPAEAKPAPDGPATHQAPAPKAEPTDDPQDDIDDAPLLAPSPADLEFTDDPADTRHPRPQTPVEDNDYLTEQELIDLKRLDGVAPGITSDDPAENTEHDDTARETTISKAISEAGENIGQAALLSMGGVTVAPAQPDEPDTPAPNHDAADAAAADTAPEPSAQDMGNLADPGTDTAHNANIPSDPQPAKARISDDVTASYFETAYDDSADDSADEDSDADDGFEAPTESLASFLAQANDSKPVNDDSDHYDDRDDDENDTTDADTHATDTPSTGTHSAKSHSAKSQNPGNQNAINTRLDIAVPLPTLIRAANFPRDEHDGPGYTALKSAMRDPEMAAFLELSETVLNSFAEDDIVTDDYIPSPADAALWRAFATDQAAKDYSALAGIRERSLIAIIADRLKTDRQFSRDTADFTQGFDLLLGHIAALGSDRDLLDFVDTRSGRAFMIINKATGRF